MSSAFALVSPETEYGVAGDQWSVSEIVSRALGRSRASTENSAAVMHTGYGDVRARTARPDSGTVLIASSERQKVACTVYYSAFFLSTPADVTIEPSPRQATSSVSSSGECVYDSSMRDLTFLSQNTAIGLGVSSS